MRVFAALLTSETGGTEKVVEYIHESRGMGITVLPPDVNLGRSLDFTPVGEAHQFGLQAIKNVGENTVRGILEARGRLENLAPLSSCDAVEMRLLNRRVLESLVRGAMDSFRGARARSRSDRPEQKLQREHAAGQTGPFAGGGAHAAPPEPELPPLEEWAEHELLAFRNYATLIAFLQGHPLAKHAARLQGIGGGGAGIRRRKAKWGRDLHRRSSNVSAADASRKRGSLGDLESPGYDRQFRGTGLSGGVRRLGGSAEVQALRCCCAAG